MGRQASIILPKVITNHTEKLPLAEPSGFNTLIVTRMNKIHNHMDAISTPNEWFDYYWRHNIAVNDPLYKAINTTNRKFISLNELVCTTEKEHAVWQLRTSFGVSKGLALSHETATARHTFILFTDLKNFDGHDYFKSRMSTLIKAFYEYQNLLLEIIKEKP